jgi:hypothetical protein
MHKNKAVGVRAVPGLAVIALLAACSEESTSDRAITEAQPCHPGQGRPITEATLKAVLAKRGIQLYRTDNCLSYRNPDLPPPPPNEPPDPREPLVVLGNLWDGSSPDDYDRVVSAQGFISCDVLRDRFVGGPKLERVKYEGDEETHLSTLNISCVIYPDSTEQIDALAAGLLQLPGVRR